MIGTIDIKINAAKPNFPLAPLFAFVNSPSQVRVINAPKAIGNWKITKVYVTANYPDNQSASVETTLVGGCWSATLPASTATGTSTNGFTITADGVKEDGSTAVTGYVLGKGDVTILDTDGTITTGETTYYLHILDAQPTTPKKGDICIIGGVWKIYNGTAWVALGGGGGDVAHSDFAAVDAVGDRFTINDLKGKVNEVLGILKGTAAIAFMAALPLFGGVETAQLGALYNDSLVVTNVTDIGLDTNAVNALIAPATNGAVLASVAAVTNRAVKSWQLTDEWTCSDTNLTEIVMTFVDGSEITFNMWQLRARLNGAFFNYQWYDEWVTGNETELSFDERGVTYTLYRTKLPLATTNTLGLVSYSELDAATNAVSAAVTNAIGEIVNGMITNAVNDAVLSNITYTAYFTNIVDGAVSNIVVTAVVGTAMDELLGSGWQGKYGGGAAGVIAAIFAALALLHKMKIATLKCGDLEVGVSAAAGATAGQADVSPLFSSDNTSLMGVLPYKYDAPSAPTETAILFSETSTYAVGDIVTYSGAVYHCIVAVETAGAWTGSTNWTQITTTYDASSGTYAVGDYVIYNSAYYVCKTAITTAEAFDADKWTALPVNSITVTLADATITRITLGTNVGRVNLLLAAPESGKVYESIVRFDTGSCVPSFTYGITGKSVNALEMSGDDVEGSAKFEKLLTAYAATAANTYDVTIGTKELGE